MGSFRSHKAINIAGLWDGSYGISSLSEKTRESNHLQLSLKRQHFLLNSLKTLSIGPVNVCEPTSLRTVAWSQSAVEAWIWNSHCSIAVITVEPADKISFVYNCMQTSLRGQYNGKWTISLVCVSRPLVTIIRDILFQKLKTCRTSPTQTKWNFLSLLYKLTHLKISHAYIVSLSI